MYWCQAKRGNFTSRPIEYLLTAGPSDNNLFHENSVSKYLLKKILQSNPLEIEWWPPKEFQ